MAPNLLTFGGHLPRNSYNICIVAQTNAPTKNAQITDMVNNFNSELTQH